nr:retrovirus-related Pol polyprotein from transposon TNT 1-94 [Tanacetum cinerariifolium]
MFRINPFKTSREEKHVPNTVRASVRTKPITNSQPHVITKKVVNSDSNGLSSTGVDNTKTRRPQPRSNIKNDRVPSASKSSRRKNKGVEVKEHHKKLLLSRNNKHMSSECNNVKLATQNKQKENVSINEKQKKQQPKVKKTKKVGSIERLALPKPGKPRSFLRWSPTGRLFDLKGKIFTSSESESQSNCSKGDNACTSNPLEPTIKRFPNSTFSLAGFDDLQWGNILITGVYFIEGLGHNLFSVGQFYDLDLEVAFRRNACFVKNLEGVDLLKGNRSTNLYTINLHEMASISPICLMARASSTKSWLWHQRLSHLNFDTINVLAKNDLVFGLPKFKYHNYLQQPMPNLEDITDSTTAMNMALALMAKAFKLNYSTPTKNNQRISSNPHNRQIAQPGNLNGYNAVQNVGNQVAQNPRIQNVGNQNGPIGVQGNGNQKQIRNGNLVAVRAEGNAAGHNGNPIRCYNCRRVEHFARDCTKEAGIQLQAEEYDLTATAADLDEIEEVNANCILLANLQQASSSGTQTDKAPQLKLKRSTRSIAS